MNSEYEVKEKLFAGQVAFYIEKNLHKTFHSSPVIVLSFLKDHVNVFASANNKYQIELPEYKFTHKGTMQIKYSGGINKTLLFKLFIESLGETSK